MQLYARRRRAATTSQCVSSQKARSETVFSSETEMFRADRRTTQWVQNVKDSGTQGGGYERSFLKQRGEQYQQIQICASQQQQYLAKKRFPVFSRCVLR